MPHGRHRWRGEQQDGACPRRIHRFLEPCLLLLLHCSETHGYELLDGLKPFGFEQDPVNLSTVYRILRTLEDQGFVLSHWDTTNVGPARRLYRITSEGDRYLTRWVQDLRETDQVLHHFLDTYDSHMELHQ
jgi:PadR family transcriptional regulator PadR